MIWIWILIFMYIWELTVSRCKLQWFCTSVPLFWGTNFTTEILSTITKPTVYTGGRVLMKVIYFCLELHDQPSKDIQPSYMKNSLGKMTLHGVLNDKKDWHVTEYIKNITYSKVSQNFYHQSLQFQKCLNHISSENQ